MPGGGDLVGPLRTVGLTRRMSLQHASIVIRLT
jgi:hypothetical protein